MKSKMLGALVVLAGCQTTAVEESAFLGTWKSDWEGQINTTLVVHDIEGNTVDATYSWERTSWAEPGSNRGTGELRGNQIVWRDGDLTFTWTARDGKLYGVRRAGTNVDRGTFVRVGS